MMNTENIIKLLEVKFAETGVDVTVSLSSITKNNDIVREGVTIRSNIKGVNVSPNIYFDAFKTLKSDEAIADAIVHTYCNSMLNAPVSPVIGDDIYDKLKTAKIKGALINTEGNYERLHKLAHKDFLDLSIIFKLVLQEDDYNGSRAVITVTNEILDFLGKTEDDLFAEACANEESPIVMSMMEMLMGMGRGIPLDMLTEDIIESMMTMPMFVVTNKAKFDGAFSMLDKVTLNKLAEKFDNDVYIIPSSIHEYIAIPAGTIEIGDLKDMIYEVNKNEVAPEEVLSYNVYYYNKKTKDLTIAIS